MSWSRFPSRGAAFTLVEVTVVILVLALLMSGLAMPIAAQVQSRRVDETRRIMDEAREALLAFAAAHGRLPCPATDASAGEESFAPGSGAADGGCATFYDGWLPGAALGVAPLDGGFVRDAWRRRIRYAVFGAATVGGVSNPLTREAGMRTATLPALADAAHYVYICGTGASSTASGCGPAANQLTRRAAFVLVSTGPGTGDAPRGADEARNVAGTPVFVAHEPSAVAGNEFDDLVTWAPIHLVASRLLAAGQLP